MTAQALWAGIESWLRWYVFHGNPTEWFSCFKKREGRWVTLRLIVLGGCTIATAFDHYTWLVWLAIGLAVLLAIDILLFNTAVVFVSALPLSLLRSNLFTIFSYVSLALAFSSFWLLVPCLPGTKGNGWVAAADRSLDAFYQSVRTLTTSGTDIPDISRSGKILASLEGVIGIYFLSIIVAGYLALPKPSRTE